MGYNFASNNKKGSTLKWDISKLGKDEVTWYKLREMVQNDGIDCLTFYGFMIYDTQNGKCIALQTDKTEMVQIPSRYIDTFKELPKEAIDEMKEKGVEINNFSISNFHNNDTVFFDFVNNED